MANGINSLQNLNVHSIAIQVPIKELTGWGTPTSVTDKRSTIGVWTTASRRASQVIDIFGIDIHGPFRQVSRLANPLVNEAIIPMGRKDEWNRRPPNDDHDFVKYVQHPEVARLLPVLYPRAFPNLAKLRRSLKKAAKACLSAGLWFPKSRA